MTPEKGLFEGPSAIWRPLYCCNVAKVNVFFAVIPLEVLTLNLIIITLLISIHNITNNIILAIIFTTTLSVRILANRESCVSRFLAAYDFISD